MSGTNDNSGDKKRPNIDPDFVRELATLLDETGLTEIEVEETGVRVRVARQGAPFAGYAAPVQLPSGPVSDAPAPVKGTVVTSPMVGTVYLGPAPGAPPFIKGGDNVHEGQTVVIVEAMKTMNQVPSTVAGRVVEIYVQDGQPVEYGEPLLLVD